MLKATFKVILFSGFALALLFLFRTTLYQFFKTESINPQEKNEIIRLSSISLKSLDVPVGAILIYYDTLLASGFNTVLRDTNVGGHAEINAINNAIKAIGFSAFSKLNRDHLVLISGFEPCRMCQAAINEYNIRHVLFMKGKSLGQWLKNDARSILYEWNKKQCDGEAIQDSLFMLHPRYKSEHPSRN